VLDQTDGLVSIGVAVPLGWLDQDRGAALARVGTDLVITPWRGAILTDLPAAGLDPALADLRAAGLLLDPTDPGVGVSACTGKPGCAKALADVRADAAAMLEHPAGSPLPVHWSGCARRCGRPRGLVIDVVATETGYLVGAEERPVPAAIAADLAGRGRAAR
jgi:precorrin-3B synthase